MDCSNKYLNTGRKIIFEDIEYIAEELIGNSQCDSDKIAKLKNTLWHEFGHAIAAKKQEQKLTSIRVDKWFIFFHNNDKGSIWTFTYLSKYCKKLEKYVSKESMGIKNPGSCFMKIDDISEGDTLNKILINILKANNRTGDRHKKQLNVNSDNRRIKRIKCKLFKKAANNLRNNLNDVYNLNIHKKSSDEQKIHIYARCAVILWEDLYQPSFYSKYFNFLNVL